MKLDLISVRVNLRLINKFLDRIQLTQCKIESKAIHNHSYNP